jgi:L-alanine-DL-glutamate epimerase-like enolase superfamily enzyme
VKITDIKLHVLARETEALVTSLDGLFEDAGPAGKIQYSLVRILTDAEIEGHYIVWSEVATGRPHALAEVLRHFKPHLIGQDPLDRERIWQTLGAFWYGQKGPAFAAVDIALWDIAGKAASMPIYKLLGGYRDKVRAYASGNVQHRQDEVVRIGVEMKERGFTALKLHPIPIELCGRLREEVGDEVDLIYDAVFAHTRHEAIKVGRELERLNYFWYEAPLPPDDVDGYAFLAQRLDIPLTVELLHKQQYAEFVRRQACSYLRTLSGIQGGITEMLKVAHLCESFGMNFEPHAYGGTMYQVANLHVILAVKNCALFEFPIHHGQIGCWDVGTKDVIRIDEEGYVHGPTKPGLGIDIDWEQVERGQELPI